jgi:hypothetical protein
MDPNVILSGLSVSGVFSLNRLTFCHCNTPAVYHISRLKLHQGKIVLYAYEYIYMHINNSNIVCRCCVYRKELVL